MRTFAIKNEKHRKRPAQSWLLYDPSADSFSIKISKTADAEDLPLMLTCFAEKGIYELDDRWARRFVQDRVVPSERQNLGAVLRAAGLEYYDEFALLLHNMGRCCQDDYCLEETEDTSEERSYGYMVSEERKKAAVTQAQLSEMCGIKQGNLSRIESGAVKPSLETLEAIAKGLGKELKISFV